MDVMSLDANIPQSEGIKIICKAYENFYKDNLFLHITCRKILPLQWKALPTNPWNCNGHKDSSFDSFANIFVAYIETTTLSKTVFIPTVWKCYIDDIFPYGT